MLIVLDRLDAPARLVAHEQVDELAGFLAAHDIVSSFHRGSEANAACLKVSFDEPSHSRLEGPALPVAVDDEAQRADLAEAWLIDSVGLQAAQQRGYPAAEPAIHRPPNVPGVDQVHVDLVRRIEAFRDGALVQRAQHDAAGLTTIADRQALHDVPGQRFAFLAGRRGDEDRLRLRGRPASACGSSTSAPAGHGPGRKSSQPCSHLPAFAGAARQSWSYRL